MYKLAWSIIVAAIFVILPLSASAQQQSSPQQGPMMGPHHREMMQGQGTGGGMGIGSGMGMGGHGDGCCMEHGGMMGGPGRGGMMLLGPLRQLDLNADQRTRVNRIELDLRKQLWSLKGKTLDTQAQLHDLYSADRPDPKKIGAVYARIFDVRRQMIEAKIDAMNRGRDVLNKEQLAKLKQMQQDHYCCDLD
jgi:Spy/CpxP family protein refolding chaperone